MNSINPFDTNYNTDEINTYFGVDAITISRAELEVAYWSVVSVVLYNRNHTQSKPPTPAQFVQAMDLTRRFKQDFLKKHYEITHHEIKALEYTLRELFQENGLPASELIHFGLTSQDIVDPVYTMAIRDCVGLELMHQLEKSLNAISDFGLRVGEDSYFPARTHGQLAIPTTMHKEMAVYYYRLNNAMTKLSISKNELKVKFGGAIGTFDVHNFVDPSFNWEREINEMFFTRYNIGVHPHGKTTQVGGNDDKARVFSDLIAVNNIIIDLCQDMWQYFSHNYLTVRRDKGHVGSSAMPQKNNPIEFENIEGMLQSANADLHFLIDKLTRSRGQRDLSDSVAQRFYGLTFSKCLHGYKSLSKAISKLEFLDANGRADISNNAQIFAEIVQSLAKLDGIDRFEEIKNVFNKQMSMDELSSSLSVLFKPESKKKIKNYVNRIYAHATFK